MTTSILISDLTKPERAFPHKPAHPNPKVELDRTNSRFRANDARSPRSPHDLISYVYGRQPHLRVLTFAAVIVACLVVFSAFYALLEKRSESSTPAYTRSEQAPPTSETQQPAPETNAGAARVSDTQKSDQQEQPRFADLRIRSNPDHARVLVDGVAKGVTPLVLRRLPAGEHKLVLSKDGYEQIERAAICRKNVMTNLKVTMKATKTKSSLLAEQTQNLLASLITAMQKEDVGGFVSLLDPSNPAFIRSQKERTENLFSEFDNITESHSSVEMRDSAGDRIVVALHRTMSGTLAETGRPVKLLDADQKFTLIRTSNSQWRICSIE